MVVVLTITLTVISLLLLASIAHIRTMQKQLVTIDKEQHQQNQDIIDLLKGRIQHQEILLQHIEILKYLIEQDPILGKTSIPYTGPIGEA